MRARDDDLPSVIARVGHLERPEIRRELEVSIAGAVRTKVRKLCAPVGRGGVGVDVVLGFFLFMIIFQRPTMLDMCVLLLSNLLKARHPPTRHFENLRK